MGPTSRKVKEKNRKRKRRLAEWQKRRRVEAGERVNRVKRGQVLLTPVPIQVPLCGTGTIF